MSEYSAAELTEVAANLRQNDAYELGLDTLRFSHEGDNKKVLDQIVLIAREAALKLARKKLSDFAYIKVYMQVLYNAGVTLVYGSVRTTQDT